MSGMAELLPIPVVIDRLYYQINEKLAERLQVAGFVEIRAAHGKVFENLGSGCRVSELAEKAQVTKQSMAELVAYLEEHDYLIRSEDKSDRRAKIVHLTSRGKRAARAAELFLDEIYEEWTVKLGSKRLAEVQSTLSELLQIVKGHHR